MTQRLELYKCNVCGNIVEVVVSGAGELVCCSQPMEKIKSHKIEDESNEKHLPCFSCNENGQEIRVGSVLHPMESEHYIQFVEAISADKSFVQTKYFNPGEMPVAVFKDSDSVEQARAYCNLHGLWVNEK